MKKSVDVVWPKRYLWVGIKVCWIGFQLVVSTRRGLVLDNLPRLRLGKIIKNQAFSTSGYQEPGLGEFKPLVENLFTTHWFPYSWYPIIFSLTADQTPTPTRFLKNCEEVGLFNEPHNPFDAMFRKASEHGVSGLQGRASLEYHCRIPLLQQVLLFPGIKSR